MEDDLPRVEEGAKHYFVEDEEELKLEESVDPKSTIQISQFLKLPQRQVHTPRVVHESLVEYSLNQVLTSYEHIQSMEEIAAKKT